MINPWVHLPSNEPFVLQEDLKTISEFNRSVASSHKIRLNVPPNPFLGDPNAPIVLLSLNPGYHERDYETYVLDPSYMKSHRKMLLHRKQDYPFVHLNPRFSTTPGYTYYTKRLRWLIDNYGSKTVSNNVLWIQYFPYSSKEYRQLGIVLWAQRYGFDMVTKAMERHATIILMRHRNKWLEAVPKLAKYGFHELNSPRAGSISPGNSPTAVVAIQKILQENT